MIPFDVFYLHFFVVTTARKKFPLNRGHGNVGQELLPTTRTNCTQGFWSRHPEELSDGLGWAGSLGSGDMVLQADTCALQSVVDA